MREYKKYGKSSKYKRLKKEFDEKLLKASSNFIRKNVDTLKLTNPSKAYNILKKMGARPGDNNDCTFTLNGHEYLTPFESANKIAEHFSKVSKEFTPLGVDKLPVRVQNKLESPEEDSKIPTIEEYQIFEKIKQANKPKVGVPGDVPRRIVEEFSAELCTPLRKVFQSILNSAKLGPVKWPLAWKKEYG